MSKQLLNKILNTRKKPAKLNGKIVSRTGHLSYVIRTNNGKMQVDALTPYKIGDRVVVYDRLIQSLAGDEPAATSSVV